MTMAETEHEPPESRRVDVEFEDEYNYYTDTEYTPRKAPSLLNCACTHIAALSASALLLIFLAVRTLRPLDFSPLFTLDFDPFVRANPVDVFLRNLTLSSLPGLLTSPLLSSAPLETAPEGSHGGLALLPWHARDWSLERGKEEDGKRIGGTQVGRPGRPSVETARERLQCLSLNGSWVYDPTPRKLPWNKWGGMNHPRSCEERWSGLWGAKADKVVDRGGEWSVRPALKYKWVTEQCHFKFFDVEGFCRAVGPGNNILLVGDSMTWQFYDSMRNYLLSTPEKWKHHGGFKCSAVACHRVCEDVLGKGQGFDIDWIRTDYLNLTDIDVKRGVHQDNRWVQYIDELKAKIIILNRGPHYEEDIKFEKSVRAAVAYVRRTYPDILLIFRNTASGHFNCSQYDRPILEPQPRGLTPASYHWDDFPRQNDIAKNIIEEFGGVYMDVAYMLSLRPDSHRNARDCLHYCQPGPVDWWVDLFYNILLNLPR